MEEDQQKRERERITFLANKWLEGNLTQQEELEFNAWYDACHDESIDIDADHAMSEEQLKEKLFEQIQNETGIPKSNQNDEVSRSSKENKEHFQNRDNLRFLFSKRVAVLLFAIAVFSAVGYYSKKEATEPITTLANSAHKKDILPGTEKAILTLASGRKLLLDSTVSGLLAIQGNLNIMATTNGGLLYEPASKNEDENNRAQVQVRQADSATNITASSGVNGNETAGETTQTALEIQNTLSTPRGALYHLTLSDGTKVWINAASSITFPVRFKGRDRQVKIKGEAYFEVAKNPSKPFKVTVDEMEVTVLGTHFNINAYRDQSTLNTTLLEGSVNVRNLHNGLSRDIQPGHEAKIYPTDEIKVASVNTELSTAWKNGLFQFEKTDLHTLLNEVSRWYNIRVEWRGKRTPDLFTGTIPRSLKLSELLAVLDYANVRFRLVDNKLTVYT